MVKFVGFFFHIEKRFKPLYQSLKRISKLDYKIQTKKKKKIASDCNTKPVSAGETSVIVKLD